MASKEKSEKNLDNICKTLGDIDFSTFLSDKEPSNLDLSEKAGLKLISSIVDSIIGKNRTYFFEYSIIASSISPETRKLFSFSCLRDEDPQRNFKNRVEKYVSNIINGLYPSSLTGKDTVELLSNNWFHNPEMFLFPTLEHIKPYHIGRRIKKKGELFEINESNDTWVEDLNDNKLFYKNMTTPRTFDEMIAASKLIAERINETDESKLTKLLINEYHQGAETLKFHYDHYLAPDGSKFGYITFPIISAYNKYLDNYFKTFFEKSYENKHAVGIGHFFLYYNYDEDKLSPSKVNKLFVDINQVVNHIALSYVFSSGISLTAKARQEAIKSVKAAIMSRNMSHNLGSHVMAYVKNDLRNIPAILDSDVLHNLYPERFSGDLSNIQKDLELPFLVGLGSFIGYLQERQDYIATIASAYIPSFSPVNFKEAIYDELNPDKRFERHHQSGDDNHNRPQNILLSYIAKSEKLSRKEPKEEDVQWHDIRLGFKNEDDVFWGDIEEDDNHGLPHLRKFNFALPGGMVGRQAIFSIVENIIRNAAKHNNVEGHLELVFECIDGKKLKKNPDKFSNSITDIKIRSQYKAATDTEHLYILSITDNLPCSKPTIKKLKDALSQDYLGKSEHSNKGIKEIRISAAWLRGEEDESVFAPCPPEPEDESNVIWKPVERKKAPVVAIELSKEGHLRYLIGLRRTYEFALVYSDSEEDVEKNKFVNRFSLPNGTYEPLSNSEIIESDTCYEYIIAKDVGVYEKIRPGVTNRCITLDSIGKECRIGAKDIYCAYTGIPKSSKEYIYILDDRTTDKGCYKRIKMVDKNNPLLYPKYPNLSQETGPYNGIIGEGVEYLYRSHHFSESDFAAYWKDKVAVLAYARQNDKEKYNEICSQVKCIDAITGDNSSDRLVRREALNEKWYYNHLYALKSKVAIFDERLFQIIHGMEEAQLVSGSFLTWSLIESCKKGEWPNEFLGDDALSKKAESLTIDNTREINKFKKLYRRCLTDKGDNITRMEFVEFLSRYEFKVRDEAMGSNHLTAAYKEKGVDIFTIIPSGHNLCYIVGCEYYDYTLTEKNEPQYAFRFKPIAELSKDADTREISCIIKSDQMPKYRYISIHQGLIDKIYEEFKLTDKEENDKVENLKKNVIRELYEKFTGVITDENASYLDRLSIHSGRGTITEKDTPMTLPFIQYSALEHAVLDCKYSLVELLDFAKYKSGTK